MKLLTYGSLRRFHPNHTRLGVPEATDFLREIMIPGYSLYQLSAWYPGVVKDDKGPGVLCDLYRITNPDIMRYLDQYEGYSMRSPSTSLFVRRNVTLPEGLGEAFLYEYNHQPDGELIESGDWYDFYRNKAA